jgi:hypothetical protein
MLASKCFFGLIFGILRHGISSGLEPAQYLASPTRITDMPSAAFLEGPARRHCPQVGVFAGIVIFQASSLPQDVKNILPRFAHVSILPVGNIVLYSMLMD